MLLKQQNNNNNNKMSLAWLIEAAWIAMLLVNYICRSRSELRTQDFFNNQHGEYHDQALQHTHTHRAFIIQVPRIMIIIILLWWEQFRSDNYDCSTWEAFSASLPPI